MRFLKAGVGLLAGLLLSSCGGLKCYLHDCHSPTESLETVELRVGEEMRAVRITRGMTAVSSGYQHGLIAEDPGVVRVVVREAGMKTYVSLLGVGEGETRMFYVNQIVFRHPNSGIGAYGDTGELAREHASSFLLRVVAAAEGE